MNKVEAREILLQHLTQYQTRSHSDLVDDVGKRQTAIVTAPTGNRYQIQVLIFWDDAVGGDIRVRAHIDDGSLLRVMMPLTEDWLSEPDC